MSSYIKLEDIPEGYHSFRLHSDDDTIEKEALGIILSILNGESPCVKTPLRIVDLTDLLSLVEENKEHTSAQLLADAALSLNLIVIKDVTNKADS